VDSDHDSFVGQRQTQRTHDNCGRRNFTTGYSGTSVNGFQTGRVIDDDNNDDFVYDDYNPSVLDIVYAHNDTPIANMVLAAILMAVAGVRSLWSP
jgi:hypothetical protein